MAFSLLLLPLLLGGVDPKVIATGNSDRLEQVLSDTLRAKVEAGWHVVDVRSQNDELVVTIGEGEDSFERHVIDFSGSYRVESDVAAPKDADEPQPYLSAALSAPRGGVELSSSCGEHYLRPYLIDEHATGEFASALVTRQLATADQLYGAIHNGNSVTFGIGKRGAERELVVWLDPKGKVIEAQLRRFEYGRGGGDYKRKAALKSALSGTRITSIIERGSTMLLVTGKGQFMIDPDGEGFYYADDREGHCGC